jgi:hypothetical protein
MSVSESDKFLDLDEEGSAREETTGILGLPIPDLIQAYDDEEIFSGRDPLGKFERDHVLRHLKYQSPEPVRTPSPRQKRGGSTDEPLLPRKRCAPFCILRQGDHNVLVRIDPGNPSSSPRRVVWGEERFKVVQAIHEGEGHYGGAEKTRLKVADRYWFSQLTDFVREFVKACDVCQKERVGAAPQDDQEIFPTPPTAPWFRTHVDLCGPFEESGPQKFRYVAVAVDSVTKFVKVRPLRGSKLKGVDSEEVADFLQTETLHRYPGVYEVVIDRGGEFGAKFLMLCKAWEMKHVKVAAKNPKANGQVERYMRVIIPAIRKCAHEHPGEWHKHVSGVVCDMRASCQETIKMLPILALFGREAILPIEREILTLSALKQPNLDQDETEEQRKERFKSKEQMQSLCNLCARPI